MLTIHLQGRQPREALTFDGGYDELFRTVAVMGEVPFIQLTGQMVNLALVERIEELAEAPTKVGPGGVEQCPHGFIEGTCSACGIT